MAGWCGDAVLDWCGSKDSGGQARCLLTRCFCCSLRTGVLVIASFEIVFCVVMGVFVSLLIPDYIIPVFGRESFASVAMQLFLHLFVASVLIHGVRTNNRGLLWGWLWARGAEISTDCSQMMLLFALYFEPFLCGFILVLTVSTCFSMVVVRSYVLELKKKAAYVDPAVTYRPSEEKVGA